MSRMQLKLPAAAGCYISLGNCHARLCTTNGLCICLNSPNTAHLHGIAASLVECLWTQATTHPSHHHSRPMCLCHNNIDHAHTIRTHGVLTWGG
jgi:hypothetical protein